MAIANVKTNQSSTYIVGKLQLHVFRHPYTSIIIVFSYITNIWADLKASLRIIQEFNYLTKHKKWLYY